MSASLHADTFYVAQADRNATDAGPGTADKPWATLARAADQAGPGDVILIGTGVYREHIAIKRNGTEAQPIRFEAAPGAHVVLTGADRLEHLQKMDGQKPVYSIPWTHRFIGWSPHMAHPDDEYHRLIGRCEQVAIEGYLLHQVLEENQLSPGSFFADTANQRLEVWDAGNRDLNQLFVEASTRDEILHVTGDYVEIHGLNFRMAANMAQHGAVVLAGARDVLEDCVLEQMNSSGAGLVGTNQIVRRCVFRDNGQLGFGAAGAHHLLFTECLVENNNTKAFSRGWEAGGDKLVLCREAVLDHCRFVYNRGSGIWFDIGNEHCTVRNCLIADNEDAGLFNEISYGLQAHDNVIVGNGFATTPGAWGAQAGITLSSSPDSVIERNLLIGNREGFDFREQGRTTPRIGHPEEVPIWNHDEIIRHNVIALNRDAQIWGWFDTRDNRIWPSPDTKPGSDATPGTQPPITLKDLRLHFEGNDYFAGNSQGFIEWGTSWGRHKSYSTLPAFQTDIGIDRQSFVAEPDFSNFAARDFRLSRGLMQRLKACYPQGTVPGCNLGVKD